MHKFVYGEIIALWILWWVPVFVRRASTKDARRSRTLNVSLFGMLLQGGTYAIVAPFWGFWTNPLELWSVLLGSAFGVAAVVLMWVAIPALGKQWRLAAGVNQDHVLVRSGPYSMVRHPIYTSMLALLLALGFLSGSLLRLAIAFLIFMIGTEIRVRAEEAVLRERFGPEFEDYRARVPALIPRLW